MNLRIVDDLADEATAVFGKMLLDGTRGGRRFTMALSGGRTPWEVFSRLSGDDTIPWPRVTIYQVDERIAPAGDPARNLTRLESTLASRVPAVLHPMPVEDPTPSDAAERYAAAMPSVLDLVHLGLGADGHTASLVPDDPVLQVTDTDVAVTREYKGHRRMTLTFPALNRARAIVWIVSGSEKRAALRQLIENDPTIPASSVSRYNALVLTDLEADLQETTGASTVDGC